VLLDAGDAWYGAGVSGRAVVHSVFARAAYLRVGDDLLALCGPDVASGPLHLRVDDLPVLSRGAAARLRPGGLSVGDREWRWGPRQRWRPPPVDPAGLRHCGALAARTLDGWTAPARVGLDTDVIAAAAAALGAGDRAGLARSLSGRGPGLTPAGDDVLAGVVVVEALRGDVGRPPAPVLAAARTTDVAVAFLRWAARGRCIEPVHRLLAALSAGRAQDAASARRALLGVGASSGAALALGLRLALTAVIEA